MPKITDLTPETTVAPTAVIPIVDVATNTSKKTTVTTLAASTAFTGVFAPINNPTFTGTVVIPNGVAGTAAVNKDQLDLKANSATPTFTGPVTVPTPTTSTSAANKAYVDSLFLPGEVYISNDPPATPHNVELWYDVDAVATYDYITRMMINEQFAWGVGAGVVTSTTNADIPVSPAFTVTFTKIVADSLLTISMCTSFYTSAVCQFWFAVNIGGTDYDMMQCFSNVASVHDGRIITKSFSGIAAGTYTIKGRCRMGSSQLNFDVNDTLSMHVREVRRT